MNKHFKLLSLFFGLMVATTGFVACGGDDDDDPPAPQPQEQKGGDETPKTDSIPNPPAGITTDDLVGVWKISGMDERTTYTFTKDKLTIASGDQVGFDGPYTLNDGVITYTTTYEYYNQQTQKNETREYVVSVKIDLLYDKSVLVWKVLQKNDNGDYYEFSHLMYKDGATINASVNDIQGTWHWYMYGDTEYVRAGLTIKDATFDLIITPWGQRYTGTFTYRNGYIILNTTNGYTSREAGTGDGWGEGNLDPITLEGQWSTLDRENWTIWERMPFIANGTEAYGIVANLSALFVKK